MLKINVEDGTTYTFDLDNDDDARIWVGLQADLSFQATIRAMTVTRNGATHTVVRPAIGDSLFSAELEEHGERVSLFAHGVRAGIMVHAGQHRASRITLDKVGKPAAWLPGRSSRWRM